MLPPPPIIVHVQNPTALAHMPQQQLMYDPGQAHMGYSHNHTHFDPGFQNAPTGWESRHGHYSPVPFHNDDISPHAETAAQQSQVPVFHYPPVWGSGSGSPVAQAQYLRLSQSEDPVGVEMRSLTDVSASMGISVFVMQPLESNIKFHV